MDADVASLVNFANLKSAKLIYHAGGFGSPGQGTETFLRG